MYYLSCHCGGVNVEIEELDLESARRCDCSYCKRRGAVALTVPVGKLRVTKDDTMALYTFNTGTAKHYFCTTCGNYTHHQRRSNPNEYGVNAGCIEGIDPKRFEPVPWMDGINHPSDRKS